jgi:acyl carrier protein
LSTAAGSAAGALPERLRGVVAAHLKISPDVLRPETQLGRDLCMDSLAAAELLVTIEDELHVQLLSEVLADRDEATYADLEKIVLERMDAAG